MDRDPNDPPRGLPPDSHRRLYPVQPGGSCRPPPMPRGLLARVAAKLADRLELNSAAAQDLVYLSIAESLLLLVDAAEAAGLGPRDERAMTWVGFGLLAALCEADDTPCPANDG